jgi:homoserine O-succinyltransferase/O-acetyltransferase
VGGRERGAVLIERNPQPYLDPATSGLTTVTPTAILEVLEPLRVSLVDMNNGVPNEAVRCFRRLLEGFSARVRAANPGLSVVLEHVQPRNLGELPSRNADLVLSSGGPGSPHDGWEEPWCTAYRVFLDTLLDRGAQDEERAPKAFLVCHSFEIAVQHFRFAEMTRRHDLKFAIFPAYLTEEGERTDFLGPFAERLFVWEHRRWQAVGLDATRLAHHQGAVLATESRPGQKDKGEALLALRFGPGLEGTQFHPEADRPGVLAWIHRPEHTAALRDAYGHSLLERMMKTLDDPSRLARTYALLIPGWLTSRFNTLAPGRGLRPIPAPVQSMREFEAEVPLAS